MKPLRTGVRPVLADHTVVIAASCLCICGDKDMIIVMQKGLVFQTGPDEELLSASDLYRRIHMRQLGIWALHATMGSNDNY